LELIGFIFLNHEGDVLRYFVLQLGVVAVLVAK
jgi:hypothetical protein